MVTAPRKIFISYRQQDNREFVERIRDWFIMRYGRANVFMDFDTIPPMAEFEKHIRKEVKLCDVFVAIIGPRWLELMQAKGAGFKKDYLQMETSLALQLGKPIAPICIMDAQIPDVDKLPAKLRKLLNYNAASLKPGRDFLDNIERILEAVEQALRKEAQKYYEGSNTKSDEGDYDGIIEDCTEAIRLYPEYAEAYNRRGAARDDKGDYEGAIVDYTEAIRINPKYSLAYTYRAISRENRDKEGAIADYTEAINIEPNSALAYYNRAILRDNKEDYDGAITDYSQAIRIDPQDTEAYENRALAYFSVGKIDNAFADYNEVRRINPVNAQAYGGLGDCYYRKKDFSNALIYYRRYLKLAGSNASEVAIKRIKELEQLPK